MGDMFAALAMHTENTQDKAELEGLAKKHKALAEGLLQPILKSGDGKTPETAYRVISIPEEYMTLSYLGYYVTSQIALNVDNKFYDVMVVKNQSGEEQRFYFDVSEFPKNAM